MKKKITGRFVDGFAWKSEIFQGFDSYILLCDELMLVSLKMPNKLDNQAANSF